MSAATACSVSARILVPNMHRTIYPFQLGVSRTWLHAKNGACSRTVRPTLAAAAGHASNNSSGESGGNSASGVNSGGGEQPLAQRKCVPCEEAPGALGFLGMCAAMDRAEAEGYLSQVGGRLQVQSFSWRRRGRWGF